MSRFGLRAARSFTQRGSRGRVRPSYGGIFMHLRLVSIASFLVCATSVSSTALAQNLETTDDGYLAAKLMLGFGGEAKLETEEIAGVDASIDADMELSYGLGVAYMHPLHDYFALGGQ